MEPDIDLAKVVDTTAFRSPVLPDRMDTPCLVADRDIVSGNIRRMHAALDPLGIALRPHVKTHKSVALARMQLMAGAVGITVGTLGEAEVFASAGVEDIFLAYPLWAPGPKGARLRELLDRSVIRVGVDSVEGAAALGAAVAGASGSLEVLVEVDSGERRTGVAPEGAGEVARACGRAGLRVRGIFTHGGHSYRRPGSAGVAADDEVRCLSQARDSLEAAGFDVDVVSAGSTPTALASACGPVTEERPGTYVFGDRQQASLGGCRPDQVGLFVVATVVSASSGRFVLDCGAKSLARDRKRWMRGFGVLPGFVDSCIAELYDYHAMVAIPVGQTSPHIGEQVVVVPNHACPVVNLFAHIDVIHEGTVVDRWMVDARGQSS